MLTNIRLRLAALFHRRRLDRDLEEEIRFHLSMREQRRQREGMSQAAARTEACREFGNATLLKESTRELWTFGRLESVWKDLHYAARSLRKSPGFVAVMVTSLALGIGANATVF